MSEATLVEKRGAGLEALRTIRLRIPARAEYVPLARLALSGLAEAAGLPDEVLADLRVALTEAVSSVVRHGHAGAISVSYELHPDRIAIEVASEGDGLTPLRAALPESRDPAAAELGMAIIRALADELEIGSRLRFAKRLPKPLVV